jgi:Na+/melibiose symporter-like transporter
MVFKIKKTDIYKLSIAMIGNTFSYMIMYFLLPQFYKEYVFLPSIGPAMADMAFNIITIAFLISSLVFLFSGYISDKTRTRFGRRKPYFLLVIPSAICYILLGIPPNFLISMGYPANMIFLTIFVTLYAATYRIIYCNYVALYVDLTPPKERITTSIIMNLFGMIGTISAFVIPVIFPDISSYFPIVFVVGILYVVLVLFVFFFGPKEDLAKIKQLDLQGYKPQNFLGSFSDSIKDKKFLYYLIASFFFVTAYSVMTTVFMDFLAFKQNYIEVEFWQVFLVLVPTAIFGFWFFKKISNKRSKITSFKIGLMMGFLVQPFMIFLSLIGNQISLIIQLLIIFGILLFVLLSVLTYQNAILMDIAPPAKEASYSGIWLFISVLGMPVATYIIFLTNSFFQNVYPYNLGIWLYRAGEYPGHDFAYALLLLIGSLFYFLAYIFLRKVKYKEEIEEKVLRDIE